MLLSSRVSKRKRTVYTKPDTLIDGHTRLINYAWQMEAGCKRLQRNPQVIKLLRCRCNFDILKRRQMNGWKDEAVPAADGSWLLLPRQRNPPRRATPLLLLPLFIEQQVQPVLFHTARLLPTGCHRSQRWKRGFLRAIKHSWTRCSLGHKKKKAPTAHPPISCQRLVYSMGGLSLSVYIFLILFSITDKYWRQRPRHYRPVVWSHMEALSLVQIYLDFCVEKA